MTFNDFFEKNKKILIIVAIIVCAIIVGVLAGHFWGAIAGLFGLMWRAITKKKNVQQSIHDEKIKKIDEEIIILNQKEALLIKEISSARENEKNLKEKVESAKEKYRNMNLDDMIKEHNKSLGINQ